MPDADSAAAALADTSNLPDYQGRTVARTTISIRNAGDGLSEGLSIDPQVLPLGAVVHVVLECTVVGHDHDVMKQAPELLVLDQVLKAGTGTLIDAEVVKEAVRQQAERIQLAKEAAKGITRLPYGDELQDAHDRGEHAEGLVPGCPACDAEQAALDAEAGGEPAPEQPPTEPTPIAGRKRRGAPADS
jgi:hypothetical protein